MSIFRRDPLKRADKLAHEARRKRQRLQTKRHIAHLRQRERQREHERRATAPTRIAAYKEEIAILDAALAVYKAVK